MKYVLLTVLATLGLQAHADTTAAQTPAQDVAAQLRVSNQCGAKILNQATKDCNAEAKGQGDHACMFSWEMTGFSMQHPNEGTFEIVFTTGDAQDWSYLVYVTDEADQYDCSFTVKSENTNN